MCNKRSLDLRNDNDIICRDWFIAIKHLIRRTRLNQKLKNQTNIELKEKSNKNKIISNIWRSEILPYWHNYRKFIMMNRKYTSIFSVETKKIKSFKKKLEKHIKNQEFEKKIINKKNQSDVIFLWIMGLPQWLRKKIWPLVIGNEILITENLFQELKLKIEKISFSTLRNLDIIKLSSNDFKKFFNINITNVNDVLIDIVNHVIKLTMKFKDYILKNNFEEYKFKQDLFTILRVYTLYRPDFAYSKNLAYISIILLLNCENYYSSFVCLMNLIIPGYLAKFQLRDENYVKNLMNIR